MEARLYYTILHTGLEHPRIFGSMGSPKPNPPADTKGPLYMLISAFFTSEKICAKLLLVVTSE